jgi:hypothetical protein
MTDLPGPGIGHAAFLVGVWRLVRADDPAAEQSELDLGADGQMTYSIRVADRWQIMRLTYRIERDAIVSNQPSAPREELTAFAVTEDGLLLLYFGGKRSWFRRGEKKAPSV